jgi:hypothetical protein
VEQDGIHFIYEVQIFHDNSIIRSSFDQNYLNICSWLENLKTDVEKFNIGLENEIDTALRSRLGGITNTSSAKDVWDFPIR